MKNNSINERLFQPLKYDPKSIYQRIVDEIKKSIFEGRMKPGDRLPSERELASMLEVSRASVREALKMLSSEGLVNIRHGHGVFISDQDPDEYLKKFASKLPLNKDTVKHLFEVRMVLEPQTVIWVAEKGNYEEILKIHRMVETTMEQIKSIKSGYLSLLAEHDSNFHYSIARATGNSVLVLLMHSMLHLLADSRSRSLLIPGRGAQSVEEHYIISAALIKRDAEKASTAMLNHLENVEGQIMNTWYT